MSNQKARHATALIEYPEQPPEAPEPSLLPASLLPEKLVAPGDPDWLVNCRAVGTMSACSPFEPHTSSRCIGNFPSRIWDSVALRKAKVPHVLPNPYQKVLCQRQPGGQIIRTRLWIPRGVPITPSSSLTLKKWLLL